jgi:predicted Zn-dependent protease with MMP-like domain
MRWLLGLALICALSAAGTAAAYKRAEVDGAPGRYLFWGNRVLSYSINQAGCKDVLINEAVKAVQRSFFSWASPSCTDLYFLYDGLVTTEKTNMSLGQGENPDHTNLVIWRGQWPPPNVTDPSITKEMPAVTTVIYDTDTGAIVDLNGQDFFWTTTDDTTKAATDIQNAVTHEVGHYLGLAHSENKSAAMYAETHQGEISKRTLHADDILGLCTIYPYGKTTPAGSGQGSVPQDVQGGCGVAPGPSPASPWVVVVTVIVGGLVEVGRRRGGRRKRTGAREPRVTD